MKKQAIILSVLSVTLGVSACAASYESKFSFDNRTNAGQNAEGFYARQWSDPTRWEPRIVTATAPVQDLRSNWRDCTKPNPACTGDMKWQAEE